MPYIKYDQISPDLNCYVHANHNLSPHLASAHQVRLYQAGKLRSRHPLISSFGCNFLAQISIRLFYFLNQ